MKSVFRWGVQWSDRSEHSPQHSGALPSAVLLPNEERVEFSDEALFNAAETQYQAQSRATYLRLHRQVRVREHHWGDDGSRSVGQAGTTWEVLAPKGSKFLFLAACVWCGLIVEGTEAETEKEAWHEECRAEKEQLEAL